jgi:lipopolysaccharide export system permease protein
MSELNKYVLRQLLIGMVIVTIGLTCVIWLTQSLRFVDMIVNRGLTAGTFVYLTMLLLPNFLSIILPIAVFTVVVFTYSKLISDRELIVMRAAGLSQHALARPAILLAAIVCLFSYIINIFILPESYRMFRELQWEVRYNYSHVLLQEGVFNDVGNDVTVYIRQRASDEQLHGILVHDNRDKENPVTIMAERGALIESEKGARVVMFNGNRQGVNKKTNRFSILYFDRYVFNFGNKGSQGIIRYREARERPLMELLNIRKNSSVNPKDHGKFLVEAHKRLASPIMIFGFALVGLACLLAGSFSRRTQTYRTVLAVLIVITLQAASMGIENVSARNTLLMPLMYLNSILPIVLAYIIMILPPRARDLSYRTVNSSANQ